MTQVKNPGRAEEQEEARSSYSPKSLFPSKLTPMDIKSTRYLQATSMFASTKDSPTLEGNSSFYCKSKEIPFADAFPDPLCKLNLKETSEFVKAFPMPSTNNSIESRNCFLETSSVQARKEELTSTFTQKRLEAPPTPGRPVFSFSAGNFSRKSYPSKWDDAEKWVISSSCHESPAHLVKPPETTSSISRHGDLFLQKGETFAEKSKIIEENVLKGIRNFHGSFPPGHTHTVSAEVLLKDKFTDNVEPILPNLRYSEPTKEGFLFRNSACETMKDAATEVVPQVHHRDIGTEMTPLGSSTTSRCHTPLKSSSPARHNTPANRSGPLETPINSSSTINISELQECHLAKLELGTQFDSVVSNWSSREEEEEEVSKSLRHFETGSGGCSKKNVAADSRASAWEEEERTKSCIRYQREEAKIQAWVNLQSAKAEAESRKLEVKIQKMRSNLEEKLMKRMAIVHRKAEEWRATAQQQHSQQVQRAAGHAQKMKKNQHNKSCLPDHSSCGCFPCSNHSL